SPDGGRNSKAHRCQSIRNKQLERTLNRPQGHYRKKVGSRIYGGYGPFGYRGDHRVYEFKRTHSLSSFPERRDELGVVLLASSLSPRGWHLFPEYVQGLVDRAGEFSVDRVIRILDSPRVERYHRGSRTPLARYRLNWIQPNGDN